MENEFQKLLGLPSFLDTPYGRVFLFACPKGNHRAEIQKKLSDSVGFDVGAIIQNKETERPYFSKSPFNANWTHTKNLCILAYSESACVGIDAEFIRPKSLKIAERFFHSEEIKYLNELNQKNEYLVATEFFKLWCRKEAYFKCVGGSFWGEILGKSLLSKEQVKVSFSEFTLDYNNHSIYVVLATSPKNHPLL